MWNSRPEVENEAGWQLRFDTLHEELTRREGAGTLTEDDWKA
jgi:hypothetical protein